MRNVKFVGKFCVFVEEVVFFGIEGFDFVSDIVGNNNDMMVVGVFRGVCMEDLIDYIIVVSVRFVVDFFKVVFVVKYKFCEGKVVVNFGLSGVEGWLIFDSFCLIVLNGLVEEFWEIIDVLCVYEVSFVMFRLELVFGWIRCVDWE